MKKLFTGIHSAIFSVYDEKMNVLNGTVAKMVEYQLGAGVRGFYDEAEISALRDKLTAIGFV